MTSSFIQNALGPEIKTFLNKYWPYIFLSLTLYIIFMRIGIWTFIYNIFKQIFCMLVIICSWILWWSLMIQYFDHIQKNIGFPLVFNGIEF